MFADSVILGYVDLGKINKKMYKAVYFSFEYLVR